MGHTVTTGSPFGRRTLSAYCPPKFPTAKLARGQITIVGEKKVLTSRLIIANGEVWGNIRSNTCETAGTVLSVAPDSGGGLPHYLRKVAPSLKVAQLWLATVSGIQHHFIVVHLVGDHLVDLIVRSTRTNVLTIPSTTSLSVVRIVAAGCNLGRDTGQVFVPCKSLYRMVCAVDVVLLEDGTGIG